MYIEPILFEKICQSIPILCVDGIVTLDRKILLLKRKNEPAKGEWWVPGGRVKKNETLDEAIVRKIKDETGLEVKIDKQFGLFETIFDDKHTVNICYILTTDNQNVLIDEEHEDYGWFDFQSLPKVDNRLESVIKKYFNR